MVLDMDINSLSLYHQPLSGFKKGEMMVISTARQTGKSMLWDLETLNPCKEILFPMKPESKYKFSRAKWYSSKLKGNGIWRLGNEYNEMIEWCTQHFGAHPKEQDAWSRWWVGVNDINFRDAKDYEWYVLRWG